MAPEKRQGNQCYLGYVVTLYLLGWLQGLVTFMQLLGWLQGLVTFVQAGREYLLYFHEDECQALSVPSRYAARFRHMHREFFLDSAAGGLRVLLTLSSTRMVSLRSKDLVSGMALG